MVKEGWCQVDSFLLYSLSMILSEYGEMVVNLKEPLGSELWGCWSVHGHQQGLMIRVMGEKEKKIME